MTKISFELFGLELLEPLGFALNWVFTIQSWYYFKKLKHWKNSSFAVNWRWFFLFFGFSGLFGGLSHLLYNYTGLLGKIPGWATAIIAITFLELAMSSLAKGKLAKVLKIVVFAKLGITAFVMIVFFNFNMVIIHTAAGMILWIVIPGFYYLSKGKVELNNFLWAIFFMLLTLPFRILKIDLHLWFNRDDAAHIFMLITLYLFYSGVKRREILTAKDSLQNK